MTLTPEARVWAHGPAIDGETWLPGPGGLAETALYRMFDSQGVLLYVGITISAISRLGHHSRRTWFREVTQITLEWHPTLTRARAAEDRAIKTEGPRHNIQGKVNRKLTV